MPVREYQKGNADDGRQSESYVRLSLFALRLTTAGCVNQAHIVTDEEIAVIGPGARIGVINTQMYHRNIAGKLRRIDAIFTLTGYADVALVEVILNRHRNCLQYGKIAEHFPAAARMCLRVLV